MVKQFERGSSGSRGGFRGGRGAPGGGRGGRGGFQRQNWNDPPSQIVEVGYVMHPCEEYVVVKHTYPDKVPIFGRPIYLENKSKIGLLDDVFGPINEFVRIN